MARDDRPPAMAPYPSGELLYRLYCAPSWHHEPLPGEEAWPFGRLTLYADGLQATLLAPVPGAPFWDLRLEGGHTPLLLCHVLAGVPAVERPWAIAATRYVLDYLDGREIEDETEQQLYEALATQFAELAELLPDAQYPWR